MKREPETHGDNVHNHTITGTLNVQEGVKFH